MSDELQARIEGWLGPVRKAEASPWDATFSDDERPAAGTAPRPPADDPGEGPAAPQEGNEGQHGLPERYRVQAACYAEGKRRALADRTARLVFALEDRPEPGTAAHALVEALVNLGRQYESSASVSSRSCVPEAGAHALPHARVEDTPSSP